MRLLDDMLRTAWRLLLLLLVLAVTLPMASRFLAAALRLLNETITRGIGGLMGSGLLVLVIVLFVIGLTARTAGSIRDRSPGAKDRQTEARRSRLAVRRRAEDVPLAVHVPTPPGDPDPPLGSRGS